MKERLPKQAKPDDVLSLLQSCRVKKQFFTCLLTNTGTKVVFAF
jgi:hypothetical protein